MATTNPLHMLAHIVMILLAGFLAVALVASSDARHAQKDWHPSEHWHRRRARLCTYWVLAISGAYAITMALVRWA